MKIHLKSRLGAYDGIDFAVMQGKKELGHLQFNGAKHRMELTLYKEKEYSYRLKVLAVIKTILPEVEGMK